jgi:membrane-associated phospholipid phosphatase
MSFIYKIFDFIGEYSPLFFVLLLTISLSNNYNLLIFYYVGLILNSLLIITLKKVIFEKYNKKGNDMPSGHFQSMSYSLIFYLLSHKKINPNYFYIFLFIFLLIAFCTFYDCITYKYHSLSEIIVGTLFGTFFGYIFYTFYNTRNIHGNIYGNIYGNI